EYGTTPEYGSKATCSPMPGAGSSAVAVSAHVLGLSANTLYYVRLVALNAGGTGASTSEFKTLPPAPAVLTGTASEVHKTSATLGATVNPNGGTVTQCKLRYG